MTKATAHKRTQGEREQDRLDIVRLWSEGRTQREIVAWISANRRYSLSKTQVFADLRSARDEWACERTEICETHVAVLLMKLRRLQGTLWKAWEASTGQKTRVTQRRIAAAPNGSLAEILTQTTTSPGDPRFLQQLLQSYRQEAQLLGLIGRQAAVTDEESPEEKSNFTLVIYRPENVGMEQS